MKNARSSEARNSTILTDIKFVITKRIKIFFPLFHLVKWVFTSGETISSVLDRPGPLYWFDLGYIEGGERRRKKNRRSKDWLAAKEEKRRITSPQSKMVAPPPAARRMGGEGMPKVLGNWFSARSDGGEKERKKPGKKGVGSGAKGGEPLV